MKEEMKDKARAEMVAKLIRETNRCESRCDPKVIAADAGWRVVVEGASGEAMIRDVCAWLLDELGAARPMFIDQQCPILADAVGRVLAIVPPSGEPLASKVDASAELPWFVDDDAEEEPQEPAAPVAKA